jgi:hypothetical protein
LGICGVDSFEAGIHDEQTRAYRSAGRRITEPARNQQVAAVGHPRDVRQLFLRSQARHRRGRWLNPKDRRASIGTIVNVADPDAVEAARCALRRSPSGPQSREILQRCDTAAIGGHGHRGGARSSRRGGRATLGARTWLDQPGLLSRARGEASSTVSQRDDNLHGAVRKERRICQLSAGVWRPQVLDSWVSCPERYVHDGARDGDIHLLDGADRAARIQEHCVSPHGCV